MKEDIEITDSDFERVVLQSELPVLVDFWASWCIPSQMMTPVLTILRRKYKDRVVIKKINTDRNPRIRDKYKILGCPTFILFRNGKEVTRKVGAQTEKQLEELLGSMLH